MSNEKDDGVEKAVDENAVVAGTPTESIPEAEVVKDTPAPEAIVTPQPAPVVNQTIVKKGGFFPLLLGGLVAGGIGFAGGTYFVTQPDNPVSEALGVEPFDPSGLESEIAALKDAQTAADPQAVVDAAVGAAVADMQSTLNDLSTRIDTMSAAISGFDARIAKVEMLPNADGTLPDAAIAAYQEQIDNLRAEVAQQEERLQGVADQATAQMEEARAAAAAQEAEAAAAEAAATLRVAVARIETAVESGTPFTDMLPEAEAALGTTVPPAIAAAAAGGVSSLLALQEAFPEAARTALADARRDGVAGEDGGTIAGFLRNQFDVRSVAPREGSDVDAILSRADAAVREGRLTDALTEIDALPDVAKAALADWSNAARTRLDVQSALAALVETNPNE